MNTHGVGLDAIKIQKMKQCSKCNTEKKLTDFYNDKRAKDGFSYYCRKCMGILATKNNKKMSCTWAGVAWLAYTHMKENSKKKGFDWDDSWWSVKGIEEKITNGRCERTGIPFDVKIENRHHKKRPFIPSPDRIDNSLGYEPSNVQWVVFMYNVMKNNFDDEDVETFISSIKSNSL